jgi:hypothetical protein
MIPGPEGERPEDPLPTRPPSPCYRRSVFAVLAALAVALVLSVIEANVVEQGPVPTQSTHQGQPIDVLGPRPEDIMVSVVVTQGMDEAQTDPDAWSHVTEISTIGPSVIITVDTESKALVERICEQARRYMYTPNPYGPKLGGDLLIRSRPGSRQGVFLGLGDKNDACVTDPVQWRTAPLAWTHHGPGHARGRVSWRLAASGWLSG